MKKSIGDIVIKYKKKIFGSDVLNTINSFVKQSVKTGLDINKMSLMLSTGDYMTVFHCMDNKKFSSSLEYVTEYGTLVIRQEDLTKK